jgi:hypothetical protein
MLYMLEEKDCEQGHPLKRKKKAINSLNRSTSTPAYNNLALIYIVLTLGLDSLYCRYSL